jgi:hypothetical protein
MIGKLRRDERGIALITVLILTMVALGLVSALTAYALGSTPISRHDQDWNAALGAAQAGLNDYVYRLNQNGNYWQYSTTTPPPDGNQAFSTFVTVPGPSNQGTFRYVADTSSLAADGTIKLTVTGKVHNVNRTVYATLRKRSFLDYLYFTEYETKDPANYLKPPDPFTPSQAQTNCSKHYYEGRNSSCITIYFTSRDVINGPLHTNDAMNVCGDPDFNGPVTSSWQPASGNRWLDCGGSSPTWQSSGDPKYAAPLTMPPSNTSLKSDADGTVGGDGCLYTGPTEVLLLSGGTMNVTSPFTKSTNPGCGPGTGLTLPSNGVIYVQNVPSDPADPNYTSGCPYTGPTGTYPYPPGLPVPIVGDLNTYNCVAGDAFVVGTLKGQLTIGAESNINFVGNTKYAGGTTGTDILGVIANGQVNVFHPVDCTNGGDSSCDVARKGGTCFCGVAGGGGTFDNAQINSAILSVQHTFIVPYYNAGAPRGSLTVTGAIGQKYRGPVGTFNSSGIVSGYSKAYTYDSRLKYLSPPRFLNAVQAAWQIATWGEIPTPTWP